MTDDAELLRAYAKTGDQPAFAEFVRRHVNLVYFAALRRTGGNTTLAEDVAQLVFAAAARDARKLAGHPTVSGWLHTTTRFAAAKFLRAEKARQERDRHAALEQAMTTDDPAPAWDRIRPVIDEVLAGLGERDREAVLRRFFEGQTFAEVGARLHISEDAARMRVDRALEKLRAGLVRHGIDSTGAALAAILAQQGALAAPAGLATSIASHAVAGTSLAAGGLTGAKFFGIMSTTKIMVGVTGIVLAAATAITLHQQQTVSEQRQQIAALQQEHAAATALREENRQLAASVAAANGQQTVATAEHAELLKLRAEKEAFQKMLAARRAAASRATAETGGPHSSGSASLAPGMVSPDLMANMGRATPSAAAQTMVWAMQRGDVKTAAQMLTFDPAERAKMEAFIATLPDNVRSQYGTPEEMLAFMISGSPKPIAGVQLLERTQPDAETEVQHIQLQYQSGEVRQDEITFRRDADGWKQVASPALVDRVIGYFKSKP